MGTIPNTVTDLEFVTTCLEALGAMTAEILLPEYYENSLKIKYASDATAANMIDLIHDSISSPFACAYNHILNRFMLGTTFCDQLTNQINLTLPRPMPREKRLPSPEDGRAYREVRRCSLRKAAPQTRSSLPALAYFIY